MLSQRIVVLAAAVIMTACASTQPSKPRTPPPEAPADYFPLATGWKWAYEVEKNGEKILATYAVVSNTGAAAEVRAGEERTSYAIRPEGISRLEALGPNDFILKAPIHAGAEWAIQGGTARVVAVGETVTVPAGAFGNCAVVEESRTQPDRVLRTTYAAGVGPIQLEYQVSEGAPPRFNVILRARLLGVTKPGEDPFGNSAQ
jgi:hypothetical protein